MSKKDLETRVDTHKSAKVNCSISIDPIILKKAHELGLNVSKITENTLRDCIDALENRNTPKNQSLSLTSVSFGKEKPIAGPMGFEPMTFSLEG
jgi:hypothetical protein